MSLSARREVKQGNGDRGECSVWGDILNIGRVKREVRVW